MGTLFCYSILAGVFLLAGYTAYRMLLAGEKQAGLNRVVLLGVYAAALAAPVWMMLRPAGSVVAPEAVEIAVAMPELTDIGIAEPTSGSILPDWAPRAAMTVYAAGAILLALWTIGAIVRLMAIVSTGRRVRRDGYTLVLLERCDVPFSFWRYVVMSRADAESSEAMVTAHELGHLWRRHWVDLLVAQAACALMWYNPAAWLMRAELRRVHEYQADGAALASGVDTHSYQMLILEKASGMRLQSLANSLNHSNISKRIAMMYKQNNRTARRLRVLALLPAMLVAAAAVNSSAMSAALDAVVAASAPKHEAVPAVTEPAAEVAPQPETAAEPEAAPESAPAATEAPQATTPEKATEPASAPQSRLPIARLPEYPGGQTELLRYLSFAVKYPAEAIEASVQGKVVVGFTVGADGKVGDIKVIQGVMPALNHEAMRVVGEMPDWTPAVDSDGNHVACAYALPVMFKLTSDGEKNKKPEAIPQQQIEETVVLGHRQLHIGPAKPGEPDPVYYVNGQLYEGDMSEIKPGDIQSIEVRKKSTRHPGGEIHITLKAQAPSAK